MASRVEARARHVTSHSPPRLPHLARSDPQPLHSKRTGRRARKGGREGGREGPGAGRERRSW
eukprot:1328578-Rhodomonas_salina.1